MNDCCVREKTVEEYILDLGRPELCHDYPGEANRIVALLKEREKKRADAYAVRVRELESQIEMQNTIIRCLTLRVQMLEG